MDRSPLNIIPTVIESSARGERFMDIYSLLLKERIVFLGTQVDDQIANVIVAQLLYLAARRSRKGYQPLYPFTRRRGNGGSRNL